MRRQAVIGAALLVAVGVVLGGKVFRSDIAQATGVAQSVAGTNRGATGDIGPGTYTEFRGTVNAPNTGATVDVLTVPGLGVFRVNNCAQNNSLADQGVGVFMFRNTTNDPLMYFTYEADDFSTARTSRRADGLLKPNADVLVLTVFTPNPGTPEVNAGEATIVNPNRGVPVTVFTSAASLVGACHFEVRVLIPSAKFTKG